jgi:HEAT repeat protein
MREPLRQLFARLLVIPFCLLAVANGQAPNEPDQPPTYRGKSAAQWIELLSKSGDARLRSQAAEALGFIARESRLTYGGFSDIPIDSEEPTKLSDEALQPIVAALTKGLSDRQGSVRASSAIALSWIGPRAKSALPALVRQLDDAHADSFQSALKAIGRMGPAAKEAIPRLQSLLSGSRETELAEALRLVGANPDSYIPALIANLPEDHAAAMTLGQLGDPAVPALLEAMQDENPGRRKYAAYAIANMAGWEKLTKNREEVAKALVKLAQDKDREIAWHATQAIGSVHAAPEHCVPALIALLKHADESIVETAAESLGEFGAEAKAALPALIDLLGKGNDEFRAAYAIREIGLNHESVETLSKRKIGDGAIWLLIPLLDYREAATDFLRNNPQAVDIPARDRERLVKLMREPPEELQPLCDLLYENEQLPLPIMAELGDRRFLPLIERKSKAASKHEKTTLAACARACGAKPDRVISIDASRPGDFKPKSAWPGTDATRMSPQAAGHGDGVTHVIITGQILRADGKPATAPKFFRTNDAMLLGTRIREEEPITYDPKSGRFVFCTSVFAAYSMGEDQPEPGPYQTGSSLIQIECEGCNPLKVQFYDEMPDVRITLATKAGK